MKVFTENSVYELDLINHQYRRTANDGSKTAVDNLQYSVWHKMVSFDLKKTLIIKYPESECGAAQAGMPCSDRHYIETSRVIKVEDGT